jgi:(p)ppGpp synthase/HD superfamily hydrolase
VLKKRFDRALAFAAKAHRRQVRKGGDVPYLGHLLGVAALVLEEGGDEEQAIAALLHDAVEDQGGKPMLKKIRRRFGKRVAGIVEACSDSASSDPSKKLPWKDRKSQYLDHLATAAPEVLLVSLADKLYNARSILLDYRRAGPEVWDRFHAGRDDQLWYYRQLADTFLDATEPALHVLASELDRVVTEIEHLPAGRGPAPG